MNMKPITPKIYILNLPVEIQTKILEFLGYRSQFNAAKVCRLWLEIILSAPAIKKRRYRKYHDDDKIHLRVARLHKTLNRLAIRVYLSAGEHERKWFFADFGEGDNHDDNGHTGYDDDYYTDSTFLDEPLFWKPETSDMNDLEDDISASAAIALWLNVFLWTGLKTDYMDWAHKLVNYVPTPSEVGELRPSSKVVEEQLAISLTLRTFIDAFVAKLIIEVNNGNTGFCQTPNRQPENPSGACCRCHGDGLPGEVHRPQSKGGIITVRMYPEHDDYFWDDSGEVDSSWCIAAEVTCDVQERAE